MSVRHRPSGNPQQIEVVQACMATDSRTVLWIHDMHSEYPLYLVRWGGELYLPVERGMRLGIGIYNGNDEWRAYPTYIGAVNIHGIGSPHPALCSPQNMWEVRPSSYVIMDAFVTPDAPPQPLTVLPYGQGHKIGRATPTDMNYDLIRVYERRQQPGSVARGQRQIRGPFVSMKLDATSHLNDNSTGVSYVPSASMIAALRMEARSDLLTVLRDAGKRPSSWTWAPESPDWFKSWRPGA